ncbi:shikimate dehydrogenase [Bacillus sp. T33-2]|uniref:shikimate dehydrogenase n=1 Tax=Bacillus sp. T33-2 TaxID=2054168 RepID=UPI000C78B539|nr:shikimate dehydrogenase [Bacillus sp. T33-2]PLR93790.1 shikimate dehydrogenase [Bacillus sp. T33-2]
MKKLYGVIGDPIAHSMSPLMHNDLFDYYRIDAHYFPFHVTAANLPAAITGFKAIGAAGFNVTIPHKTAIIPLLDRLDPLAAAIGAVNTVVNEEGEYVGYNTDGPGFVHGLKTAFPTFQNEKILIIGAGGAARAIYFSLAQAGVTEIDICNRTPGNAANIVNQCPYASNSNILDTHSAQENMEQYGIIVQTTSVGMTPDTSAQPLSLEKLNRGSLVCDIIYNPLETQLLNDAASKGGSVQNGLDMFVLQGALAFEKWTGIFPDVDRMRGIVLKQLGGSEC